MLAPILPLSSSLAAAIAFTAVYGLLSPWGYAYFGIWKYSPYLSSALGAGGKFTGFLLRSIFLVNHDINVIAASTVFITAGMSACTSAQAAVLSDWFKNARAARRLPFHERHPRVIPAICRLMSPAVLIFGPLIGVPAAILMYGVRTPDSINTAMRLRKWSAWGTLACLIVLSVCALLAMALAVMHHRAVGGSRTPVLLALALLAQILLIEVSGAARVRALYQRTVSLNDHFYYPLIVLPELLQQLISLWPALLHKIGYAESYKLRGWRTATWSWVTRAFPHPDDSSATPAAAENGQACKPAGAGPGAACAASDCTASVHDDVMKKAGSTEPSTPSPGSSTC
ncbi:hypothetical protein COHA_007893 [Chlorella ohadii]|uniref:Uncharacterized protein n=1 Tax=Chlorella ohadii TaxID=2649997 RepID=A0AAD5GZH2_9CHLO|nr:hypothetical protein COHA_007893 [Chlorella ohadii]